MRFFAIIFKDDAELQTVEADAYTISEGFVRFSSFLDPECCGAREWLEVSAFSSDSVLQIIEQKKYTEEEVLAAIQKDN